MSMHDIRKELLHSTMSEYRYKKLAYIEFEVAVPLWAARLWFEVSGCLLILV